ncbi:putative phage tail protein [Buttiauxella sp. BIGb0552]|uniref:tail assembly protein n=1 Tax=Buttiauxella sp. BIGb0552 TaxID=2485120 RepID=UPI0010658BD6|nr:tail assembly protein [Buttiauxella sp. BIGb0552]TDX18477.1 putative phage tail protein [Buttiauxella sp. BIGb0552]
MNQYKTVLLSGSLAALFGRVHRLVIDTPAEACRALSVTIPGFETFMQNAHLKGLRFAVFKGRHNITKEELKHNSGDEVIRIVPVIAGSKRAGVLQTVLGAVLVVAGVLIGYFSAGTMSAFGYGMAKFGAAMMIGGVAQMLSPQAKGLASRQDPDNMPSYAFGGPVNTVAMGNPVGVAYGLRERGGAIISAGIYTDDYQ